MFTIPPEAGEDWIHPNEATALSHDGAAAFVIWVRRRAGEGFAKGVYFDRYDVATGQRTYRRTLPFERLIQPGIAALASAAGETLVVGTGDAVVVIDPNDGHTVRKLITTSCSPPIPTDDRLAATFATGTAGNHPTLLSLTAEGWTRRTLKRWTLSGRNELPGHVLLVGGRGWAMPTADGLILNEGRGSRTLLLPAPQQPNAVFTTVLELSQGRFIAGETTGAIAFVEPPAQD